MPLKRGEYTYTYFIMQMFLLTSDQRMENWTSVITKKMCHSSLPGEVLRYSLDKNSSVLQD